MLDDEKGVAELFVHTLDIGGQIVEQRLVDARRHLIEQHDLGIHHHGAAQLEQLFLPARKVACQLVLDVAEFEKIDDVERFLTHVRFAGRCLARLEP